eukprot:425311-Amphidinium_carterae.1
MTHTRPLLPHKYFQKPVKMSALGAYSKGCAWTSSPLHEHSRFVLRSKRFCRCSYKQWQKNTVEFRRPLSLQLVPPSVREFSRMHGKMATSPATKTPRAKMSSIISRDCEHCFICTACIVLASLEHAIKTTRFKNMRKAVWSAIS